MGFVMGAITILPLVNGISEIVAHKLVDKGIGTNHSHVVLLGLIVWIHRYPSVRHLQMIVQSHIRIIWEMGGAMKASTTRRLVNGISEIAV